MSEFQQILKVIGEKNFMELLGFSLWSAKGCDEFGLEISYMDDELIQFRRKKPLAERFKDNEKISSD